MTTRNALLILCSAGCLSLAGCNSLSETTTHGYQIDESALALIPEGSSRDQVQLSMGTPSTTQSLGGNEAYYYISQKKVRSISFANPRVVDQRVVAIYFDETDRVSRIANYGLKDGKVFDYRRRVTPTGGRDITFLAQVLGAATGAPAGVRKGDGSIGRGLSGS